MKPEEAINIIEDVTWKDNDRHYGKIVSAREMAISALEKQVAKKLDRKTRADGDCVCGNCYEPIPEYDVRYCPECGQKLDWSDE